jgi:hypothetical protein
MKHRICSILLLAPACFAQTNVYLRTPGSAGFVVTGASNTSPVVVQTADPHGLSIGDTVTIWGVGATVSGSCAASTANGLRVIKAVVDVTHFSVTDLSGTDVAANGPWCDGGAGGAPGGAMGGGKVTAYTPTAQPRAWLDGPTGAVTRKLALGTANGLVSLTVAGNVATATTSYSHGISVGDNVGVWGSGVAVLNNSGKPYSVTAVTATTFTFTTAGVADGTYSNSHNNCGPSGTADCLRISQLAWTGNVYWDAAVNYDLSSWESGVGYKHVFDSGAHYGGNSIPLGWALGALKALVDPSDAQMIDIAKYCVNHIERASGVNWTINEVYSNGGNNDLNDYASYVAYGASLCYMGARDYLSPAEKQTFADKMYNDVDYLNATPCNKAHVFPSNETLGSGTAQAGSSTTITLAASDSAANGYYVNNVIQATVGGKASFGLVTTYSSGSKVATVASWSNGAPAAGAAYNIYASAIMGSLGAGAATTVTGYNTHFTSDFQVGDAIIAATNPWTGSFLPQQSESYVSAINSDTSLTVINSSSSVGSLTVPGMVYILHQWRPGDCSLRFAQQHWAGAMGALPSLYAGGGTSTGSQGNRVYAPQTPVLGGNNGYTRTAAWTALDLLMADDDSRAVTDLAAVESQFWDWHQRASWNYSTGIEHSGANYSFGRDMSDGPMGVWAIANSVPSLVSTMDTAGNWISQIPMMGMYGIYPDRRWNGDKFQPWPTRWGTAIGVNVVNHGQLSSLTWQMNPAFAFLPAAPQTKYFLSFVNTFCCVIKGSWGNIWDQFAWRGLLWVDPRITASDYTVQPYQYLFQKTSAATACAATGWSCPPNMRGDAVISHSGWGTTSSPNLTATQLYFGGRSYIGDHDVQEPGTLRVYKVGHLLNSDQNPPGSGQEQSDTSTVDTVPRIGNTGTFQAMYSGLLNGTGPAIANITRWASANHGSWDTSYGDASSRYAYAMVDMTQAFIAPYNRVQRHMIHFKKTGTEEVIIQFDDIDVSNAPTQVETHIHYAQNGETNVDGYNEGNTICPGVGGCAALDSSRLIQSLEDGGSDGHSPARNYGILSQIFSPGTIFVRDDGSSYSGGNGHTHRVSLCGGSSCGAAVSQFEALIVHKIASRLSDTSLTAKMLSTDPKWAAVETSDANATGGKVALIARNGITPFLVNVQTDHPGTAQYLVAGLQPGFVYRAYRNDDGTDVASQAVSDGDDTMYFEAPAGSYSIFPDGLRNLLLRPVIPRAQVGSGFEYDFPPPGSSSAFQWRISSGRLPPGLTLSAGGVLAGTASQAGSFTFTVSAAAIANPGVSANASITLQVAPPALNLKVAAITSSQAVLAYGLRGMDAAQSCTVTVSRQPDFSTTTESFTDPGGAAERRYIAGAAGGLDPSQIYYVQAACGAAVTAATTMFQTYPGGSRRSVMVPVSVAPSGNRVTAVEVQYGSTPGLGGSIKLACSGACTVQIPAMTDTLLYTKRVFLDAADRVVAASSIAVTGVSP